jgi:Aspartyl protease/PDZ domain
VDYHPISLAGGYLPNAANASAPSKIRSTRRNRFLGAAASISMTRSLRRFLIKAGGFVASLAAVLIAAGFGNAAEPAGSADFQIIAGSEVVVPISIEAGEVIVDVSIDGRGPFPLMFDTGAEDALTPQTVSALALQTEGSATARDSGGGSVSITFARAATVRLGDAEMSDQPFAVLPLPRYLTDRGSRPPLAGFIGYELLARFSVRLDYDRKTLTLRPAWNFRYDGKGVRIPLTLAGKTPVAPAAADGIPGMFVLDTGSTGALTLRREFVEDHRLDVRHPAGLRIKSVGAAGPFEMILTRLDQFDIADSRIEHPAMRFPSIRGEGLPFTDVDGSIGYEILKQFVVTFDYRHGAVWFEHSAAFGMRIGQGGAGFQAAKIEGAGFGVTTVLPNTAAAAAGLQVGDLITEIEGASTMSMSLSDFALLMRRPVGTLVHLGTVRDGTARLLTLTLKDVLP